MELVAATKMRKSQEIALNSRPYAFAVLDLLAGLTKQNKEGKGPEILEKRDIKKTLVVLMGSDKGLVGSFNSNVFKAFEKQIKEQKINVGESKFSFVAIGEKANNFLQKKGVNVKHKFTRVGDFTSTQQTMPIADYLVNGYLKKEFDKAIIISMVFKSAFLQTPIVREILPVDFENIKKTIKELIPERGRFAELIKESGVSFLNENISDYIFEPSIEEVLEELVKHLISMQVYHLVLEANASEHAAKRMAMKNASDNAQELSSRLTLSYNKSRQAGITNELIEITAGSQI